MTNEEKKAIEYLKEVKSWWWHNSPDRAYAINLSDIEQFDILINLIEKQEEIIKKQSYTNKKMKKKLDNYRHNYRKYLNKNEKQEKEKNKDLLNKNKIIKILGFDENTSNDTIYRNIEYLVSEFERLEDIEDRKIQVEYDFVFNQGVKSVKNKIREKIEECEKRRFSDFTNEPNFAVDKVLKELLLEE